MTVYIHRKTKFIKQLDNLERGGKKAVLAASMARKLIQKLIKKDLVFIKEKVNLTKHGELRIDRCQKYDLGSGYRLICMRQGEDLIISYVGSHDDCDRWIENNRRFEPGLSEIDEESFLTEEIQKESRTPESTPEEEPDYDDILMQEIDDKLLREIFPGLCKEEA